MAEELGKAGNYAVCTSNHADYHQQLYIGYKPHPAPVTPENISRLIGELKQKQIDFI